MDNVTHALAGLLVAQAACAVRREARRHVWASAALVSALANNLPDIDIVYTWITGPKPLGSLLHHRGHTHTLLFALPAAWLMATLIWRRFARKHADAEPADRTLFLGLALAGVLLHLTMDFGNNYGVHPFWPLTGAWYYGDSIFIVEPLWWAVAIPCVAHALQQRWLKLLLWVLLVAGLSVCWFVPFVPTASRFALLGLTFAAFAVAQRGSARQRAGFALGGWLAIAVLFGLGSRSARAELMRATEAAFPALAVHDVALTPMPADPTCWEALVAGEQGGVYRVVRASVALAGRAASSCSAGDDIAPTAPVRSLERAPRGGVRFRTEYQASLTELRELRAQDCRFRAFLRFARLPYVSARGVGSLDAPRVRYVGDLRYDRQPDADFSDVPLPLDPKTGQCPRLVPGWDEPRARLFQQ